MNKKSSDPTKESLLQGESAAEKGQLLNLDMALEKVGGFGRYQWLLLFCMMITRNSGNYLYYTFGQLTQD